MWVPSLNTFGALDASSSWVPAIGGVNVKQGLFLRFVTAINAGDVEHIAEWFTENFKLHEPGVPLERVTGHEGAQRMLHHLRTAILPETRLEILDMVEEGDRVAVRWLFSGIKDGQSVVMPCVAIYRFVDGRVAEDWGITCYEGHRWP